MADGLKLPDPPDKPGSSSGGESTARVCPACGKNFQGSFHKECPSTASTLKPAADASIDDIPAEARPFATEPSSQLNQYILVKQVGRGGMGAVWKAWDRNLTRWVAIKFLLAHEATDILRFQREAKLAARLRHPNIAAIYEVGRAATVQPGTNVLHYLAMEFIDGQSLQETKLPLGELIDLFVKISQAIEAAHKGGVVHRDLKPQNIMVNAEGWPYVMDFGLAKALQTDASLSAPGAIMGTPAFMPPEQAEGRLNEIDARSDVYSLGATMYAVFCRKPAFAGRTPLEILNRVCRDTPAPPSSVRPEIPQALEAIILKAMSKNRADRFDSVAEMTRALRNLSESFSSAPTFVRPAPSRGKGKWIAAAAVLLLAIGAASIWRIRPDLLTGTSGGAAIVPDPAESKPKPDLPQVPEGPRTRPREFPGAGSFTLKISVAPYAQIRKLTRDGNPVPYPRTETPIVMKNLELGTYTIELTNPESGTRVVTVAAKTDGRTWQISGNMEKGDLDVTELP